MTEANEPDDDDGFGRLQDAVTQSDAAEVVEVEPGDDYFEATRTDSQWAIRRSGETMVWGAGDVYVDLPPGEGLVFLSRPIPFDVSIRPPNVHLLEVSPSEHIAQTMDSTDHEPIGVSNGAAYNKMTPRTSDLRATEVALSGDANIVMAAYGLGSMYGFSHGDSKPCPNCGGAGGLAGPAGAMECPNCDGTGTVGVDES